MIQNKTPVPISQYEDEFEELLKIFREIAPTKILEIGTHYGGTLFHWVTEMKDGIAVSIDDHHLNRHLYDSWSQKVTVHSFHGNSHSKSAILFAEQFKPYDFIFIDGDHTYSGVKQDWENYKDFIAPEGIIVFHDIAPHTLREISKCEVDKLWNEIKKEKRTLELIQEHPSPCGIGIVFND